MTTKDITSYTNSTSAYTNISVSATSLDHKLPGLISDATTYVIVTVVQAGLLPVIVLAGATMNVINMVVFYRQGLSDRINLCLFSLAISDNGYTLLLLTTRLYSLFGLFSTSLGQYWKIRSLNLIGLNAGFMNTSNCLTMLISLERCLLVISPLKAKTMLSVRKMAGIIILAFCTCVSFCSVMSFKFDVVTAKDPVTNSTQYLLGVTSFYVAHSQAVQQVFDTFTLVVPTVTFIVVATATYIIAVRLRTVSTWRQNSAHMTSGASSPKGQEASVTRMLLVVCVVYTVCNIPCVLRPFLTMLFPEFDLHPHRRYVNAFYVTKAFLHLMACINSSVNFLIYYVMSTRFRDTLAELFHQVRQAAKDSSVTVLSSVSSSQE